MKRTKPGAKQLAAVKTVREYFDTYVAALIEKRRKRAYASGGTYHVIVHGAGGGEWTIDLQPERPSIRRGLYGRPTSAIRLSSIDLIRLIQDRSARYTMFYRGKHTDLSVFLDPIRPIVVSVGDLQLGFSVGFNDTVVKVDHKNNAPRSATGGWSFIAFNDLLHGRGLKDRDLNVPISEHGLDSTFGNLASLASGGWYVVDRIRFLVNNLHTKLGFDTITITVEQDTIVLDVAFQSNNPTLQGEGNAYLVWLFGIPVGWVDAAFPDVNITNFHIQLRLVPFITDDGHLALRDIGVVFNGNLETDSITSHAAAAIRDGIASAFRDNFNTKEIRDALATAIQAIVENKVGHAITDWTDIYVDASSLTAWASG